MKTIKIYYPTNPASNVPQPRFIKHDLRRFLIAGALIEFLVDVPKSASGKRDLVVYATSSKSGRLGFKVERDSGDSRIVEKDKLETFKLTADSEYLRVTVTFNDESISFFPIQP